MRYLQKLSDFQLFVILVLSSILIYYSTQGAGMIFDFNGWLQVYETGTYKDVLNSFGYQGLHQMEQFLFFTAYKLLAYNHFGWYFAFAILHGIAAFVSLKFLYVLLKGLRVPKFFDIALLSTIFFLISPLAADTVVNKVTIHYFSAYIFMILGFYFEIKYFYNKKPIYLFYITILFIGALFSLEIAYIFPVMFAFIWFLLLLFCEKLSIKKIAKSPIAMPFVVLFFFLLLHKYILGVFIGHYGTEVHTKFEVVDLFSNCVRYFSSYLILFDYFPYYFKNKVSIFLLEYAELFIIPIFLLLIFVFGKIAKKKRKSVLILLSFFILALLALAPIANLYYVYLFPIMNDRYAYFASIFIYAGFSFCIFNIESTSWRRGIIGFYLCLNFVFLFQNVKDFSRSSTLAWNLLDDFKWFEDEVILLVDPNNYKGAKLFTSHSSVSSFAESLKLHTNVDRTKHINLVYQMNFTSLVDSVVIEQTGSNTLRVEMAQWGTWFWKNGQGAKSIENKWWNTKVLNTPKPAFELQFKDNPKNYIFLYPAGDKWRTFEFKKEYYD